jgi:hypothetical protein
VKFMSRYIANNLTIKGLDSTSYAYRRFGNPALVMFLQHFRGNLDSWDPVLIDDSGSPLLTDAGIAKHPSPPAEGGAPMETSCDSRQVVGMDLHRRRSVLVRMTTDGRKAGDRPDRACVTSRCQMRALD